MIRLEVSGKRKGYLGKGEEHGRGQQEWGQGEGSTKRVAERRWRREGEGVLVVVIGEGGGAGEEASERGR